MDYLGINIGGHDSSVCHLEIQNKRVSNVDIVLSERITKVKHQGNFPYHGLGQLFRERPFLRDIDPKNVATNCFKFHPYELEESRGQHHRDIVELYGFKQASMLYNHDLSFITHHLCHAYSALYQCPFQSALVVVSDGTGNQIRNFPELHAERSLLDPDPSKYEYLSVYLLQDGELTPVDKLFMQYSTTASDEIMVSQGFGVLFETAGRIIFNDWTTAGKVMGLAGYGESEGMKDPVTYLQEKISRPYTTFKTKKEFDQQPVGEFRAKANIASTLQAYFESSMLKILGNYKLKFPQVENLILVGGCALNCLLNARIVREKVFSKVFVPPFPNDEGVALGASLALAASHGNFTFEPTSYSQMTAALGSVQHDTKLNEHRVKAVFSDYVIAEPEDLPAVISKLIAQDEIIAWMQGRSEVGPRALGNRSILARPDSQVMKTRLNETVKYREAFRPYGATVLQEKVSNYFEVDSDYQSPFMTFSPMVRPQRKGQLASVTHVDGSSRIQTLMREQNPLYYDLIKSFESLTGLPILLNTSLNIMGQPILESLEDALKFFRGSSIKTLVYGKYVISKVRSHD